MLKSFADQCRVRAAPCARSDGPEERGHGKRQVHALLIAGLNPLVEYLTFADLLILAFTTVWSYRYTRLARQLADPERQLSQHVVQRAAWIGVAAGAVGVVFSMLIMLFEVAQLLIHFLRAPQAGVPVIQTTGAGTATWVSAADMMSLMALILGMFGELTFLILSLWLLFCTTIAFVESRDEQ